MTTHDDVRRAGSAEQGTGERRRPLVRLVEVLPELVVLLGAALVLSVGTLVTLGRLHAGGALLGAVLLGAVMALSLRGQVPAAQPRSALAAVLVLGGAAAWVVLNLPYVAQQVFLNRDPSVFTLAALALLDNDAPVVDPSPGLWSGPGFEVGDDGLVRTQNSHVVPALAAVLGRLLGTQALLSADLLVGALVLVAAWTAARAWMPWPWALLVPVALGAGLPFLVVTRGLYTEPSGSLFLLAAVTVLSVVARRPDPAALAVVGLLAGGAAMVRIDGLLVVAALTPVVGLVAVRGLRRPRAAVAGVASYLAAAALPVALGVVDLLRWSTPSYLLTYLPVLRDGLVLVGLSAAVTVAGLLLGPVLHRRWSARQPGGTWVADLVAVAGRRWPLFVGAAVAVPLLTVLSAPLWREGRNLVGPYAASVAALQGSLGLPVDGARSYDEYVLVGITWYQGWVAVLVGCAGLVGLAVVGLRRRPELLVAPVVVVPLLLLLLVDAQITPDQVWASRRLVMVVYPLLLLSAAWALSQAWGRRRLRWPAAVAAALVVLSPAATLPGVVRVGQEQGALVYADDLCARVEGADAVVVAGAGQSVAPTLAVVCGSTVVLREEVTAADAAGLLDELGPDVRVVTTLEASVEWAEDPEPTVDVVVPEWKRSLTQAPVGLQTRRLAVWVGDLVADGAVVPVAP